LCRVFFFGFVLNGILLFWNHQDPLLSHVQERQVHVSRCRDISGDEMVIGRIKKEEELDEEGYKERGMMVILF